MTRTHKMFALMGAVGLSAAVAVLTVAVSTVPVSTASAQPPRRHFLGTAVDQDSILASMARGYPRGMRQVGTSSVTLRVELGPVRVAYKPRTDSHPRGYLAEIAAYRVARLLRLDNVPPALGLRMPRQVMQTHFEAESQGEWEPIRQEIRWDAPGVARGVAIYWINAMRSTDLSTEAGVEAASPWLTVGGELPEESVDLARDLSTLFAFDYLIGNWDRLSGGNISLSPEGDRLFVRDHNVAFQAPLTDGRYRRIRRNLERVQRFSRGFVRRLQALDEAALRASLAEDPEAEASGRPILSDAQVADVMTRRAGLLSYIGALIEQHGAEQVLAWE